MTLYQETPLSPAVQLFWSRFLAMSEIPAEMETRFHETYSIGDSSQSADIGANLILTSEKTATSSLLWEYEAENSKLPAVGDLNIVLDGNNEPVCVVETTWIVVQAMSQADARFAQDYGEWDGTLQTWREKLWHYYCDQCRTLHRQPSPDMPLVFERFKVIFPEAT